MMRDHIATSLEIDMDAFDYTPFTERRRAWRGRRRFSERISKLIVQELNEALAA